ncbi:uncharacterized protein [Populus alba]|uniref:uncharacterized protein n=1 Tax=Populus alba TaxID=43335 RepID=UPI003CC6DE95
MDAKKDWRIWNKLVSETGVGWNSEIGTIAASDEWWKQKFRKLEEPKNSDMSVFLPAVVLILVQSNADIADDGLEEGSGDSEEDVIPDFCTDMARMVGEINMSTSSNTKSSGKRKERDHADVRCRKKKTSGIGVQLLTRCNNLLESMSTKSDSTSINMDREGCSIPEVMAELHSIPGVSIEDDFHDFATEFSHVKKEKRNVGQYGR